MTVGRRASSRASRLHPDNATPASQPPPSGGIVASASRGHATEACGGGEGSFAPGPPPPSIAWLHDAPVASAQPRQGLAPTPGDCRAHAVRRVRDPQERFAPLARLTGWWSLAGE